MECVEDLYVLYCIAYKIDSDVFWHEPISSVQRIYESTIAFESWRNNPKER